MANTNKVILIVILVVAGAILFAATRKENATDKAPQKQWVSRDEIAVTANAIIGELEEEAMEALPSDLRPNTEGLSLTDQEKTELFAILDSVTASGVLGTLGSSSPLGASPMQTLVKTKAHIVHKIARYERHAQLLKKQFAATKNVSKKAKIAASLKSAHGVISRNKAALQATDKKIAQLKAFEKKKQEFVRKKAPVQAVAAGETSAKLKLLEAQGKSLRYKYQALKNDEAKLKKLIQAFRKKKKTAGVMKSMLLLEKRWKMNQRSLGSVRKSGHMIEGKIKAEKRRIVADKNANVAKAREAKQAQQKLVAAQKLLEKRKADAAAKEAATKKLKLLRERQALDAKQRAKKAEQLALAQKAQNEKAAEADLVRMQYEEAQAKKEADALAKKRSDLKHKKDQLHREAARAKAAMDAKRKEENKRVDAAKVRMKADEAKQAVKATQALKKAEQIKSEGLRKEVQAAIRKKAADEQKERQVAAKKIAEIALRRQKSLAEKERRLVAKQQKDAADVRRKQQEMARLEDVAKAKAKERAAKMAQLAADQKQRELDQKKRDQRAHALKQRQLAAEREKEVEQAKAAAALEKARREAVARAADVEKKRREHMEARARLDRQKVEQDEAVRKEQIAELEKGIERIAGMSGDSIDLSSLDGTVLAELKVFIEASGGHRILPAIVKMIELKTAKEQQEEKQDTSDSDEKKPMTEREKKMKQRIDFMNNVKRITGIEPNGPASLIALDFDVLEELLAYAKTLTSGRLAGFSKDVEGFIFSKKLTVFGNQNGLIHFLPGISPERAGLHDLDIVVMDKLVELLKSEPNFGGPWLEVLGPIRDRKMAEVVAKREAVEEARATKQAAELEAIEKARVAQAEKDLEEAAAKLESDSEKLNTEAAKVDQVVATEKQRVVAEHQKEVETIEREHNEERQVVIEEIREEVNEVVQEVVADARERIEEADAALASKLVEMKQEQAEVANKQSAEATEVAVVIQAEISNTQDQAVAEALRQKLRKDQEARARVMEETAKAHALEQQAVVEETKVLKEEIEKSTASKVKKEIAVAQEKLESAVETIERQKQDLVEKKEKIQEVEVDKVDLEGDIQTDLLEQEKRNVEEERELVEETVADDVVADTAPPRLSKENRVTVSRKKKLNGSAFITMSVPSDMSPGESDTVSVFLSKEAGELLDQYHQIHKKIAANASLEAVSADEKKVLAAAGAEFKKIRQQYVQQRKDGVLKRREQLMTRF